MMNGNNGSNTSSTTQQTPEKHAHQALEKTGGKGQDIFLQCDRKAIECAIQAELEKPKTVFSLQEILHEFHSQLVTVYTHRGIDGVLEVLRVLGGVTLDDTHTSLVEYLLRAEEIYQNTNPNNQTEQFPHSNLEIAELMAIEETGLDCIRLGNPAIANSNLWISYNQKIYWSEEGKEEVLALFTHHQMNSVSSHSAE